MSRIDLQVVAVGNFGNLQAQLSALKTQVAGLNTLTAAGHAGTAASLKNMVGTMAAGMAATGQFQSRMVNLTSHTEQFGRALEKGNLRLGQYFKAGRTYMAEQARGIDKNTTAMGRQQSQIRALAREQVRLSQSVVMRGPGSTGTVLTPTGVDTLASKQQLLNQQYRIFRQVVQGGSTALVNWGKNTQWAGRQLMVGLTVPLTIFGAVAGKVFMDADKQLARLAKVYGDASKGMVSTTELEKIRGETLSLAQELSRTLGVATQETLGLAADIAATGKEGNDLLSSTREAVRLSVLGEVDRQEAMKATLAIQNVFKKDTEGLTESINFLNAVENQTSTALNDLVTGIIKAGPVVKGLGGSVEDLALMMVAMKEGGIPASEAANAIKSSLASLINPTKQTRDMLNGFGIDLVDIVDRNAGNVIGTLTDLQSSLEGIDQLSRQRAIEQMFGKFQFSRINALLTNLNKAGSQTQEVMKIAGMSTSQLAQTADRELSILTESASMRFKRAVEGIKASLIPIGESFVELGSMIVNFANSVVSAFNELPAWLKTVLKFAGGFIAIAGPVIMITGVFANFVGYLVKGIASLMWLKKAGRGVFEFYTPETIAAKSATEMLSQGIFNQAEATNVLKAGLHALTKEMQVFATQAAATRSAAVGMFGGTAAAASRGALVRSAGTGVGMLARGPWRGGPGAQPRIVGDGISSSVLWHQYPNSKITGLTGQQGLLSAARLIPGSFQQLNQKIGDRLTLPVLSGRPTLDAAALRKVENVTGTLNPYQKAYMTPGYQVAAAQAAGGVVRAQAEQAMRASGMSASKAKSAMSAYGKLAWKDPGQALQNLQSNLTKSGFILTEQLNKVAANFESVYLKSIKAGDSVDVATRKAYEAMARLEAQAIKQGASPLVVGKSGEIRKYGGALGGMALSDQALTQRGLDRVQLSQRALPTLSKIDDRSLERISALQKQRIEAEQKILNATIRRSKREQETLADQEKLAKNNKQIAMLQGIRTETAQRAVTLLQQENAEILLRIERDKKYIRGKTREINNSTEVARRAVEQQELVVRRGLIRGILKNTAAVEMNTTDRRNLSALLEKQNVEMLTRVASLKKIQVGEAVYVEMLTRTGVSLGFVDMENKKLITATQMTAIKLQQQATSIQGQIQDAQIGMFAKRKLNAQYMALDSALRAEAQSAELVRLANGKYAVQLKAAGDKILATTAGAGTSNAMGRLGRGAMFAGMAGGMGTMFLPMGEDNAAAKIGGGALMGASMGAMFGSMAAPGVGTLIGLAAGGALGAALPAIQEMGKNAQMAADALRDLSEGINGSSLVMDKFAEDLGKLTASQKLAAKIGNVSSPERVMSIGKAAMDTEAGAKLLELSKQLGGDQLRIALLNQLQQLTLLEIFTPEEAKAVAEYLAMELRNPELGKALVEGITTVLDEEGNLISDKISSLFLDTIPEIDISEFGQINIDQYRAQKSGFMDWADSFDDAKNALSEWERRTVPQVASSLDKLREAQDLTTLEFMNGNITYQEYSNTMEEIRKRNIYAADSLNKMVDAGAPLGALLKDVADAAGRGDDYTKIEDISNMLFDTIGVGERFLTQMRLGAAYGDIAVGEIQNLADLVTDEDTRKNVELIFNVKGGEDSAIEIVKLLSRGVDAEIIKNIVINSKEIGVPLTKLYASIAAVSQLPDTVQKEVLGEIKTDPEAMKLFLNNYEYAMSLPDEKKELKAEIFGNENLKLFQDNWQAFLDMDPEERKTAIFEYVITGEYNFAEPEFPTPNPITELGQIDTSAMVDAVFNTGGGGGGNDTSGIEKAYDKQIEKQNKIIENIQKEREERQKLYDLEKQAFDFAMKEQDLKNQIAIARAEGRMADAAALQSRLENERALNKEQEAERLRREEEDRKIDAANKRKEELEKAKQTALDNAKGGGGGGGQDDSAAKEALQKKLLFLNDELNAAIYENSTKMLDEIMLNGANAFWDSEPIKRYTEAAEELGIPMTLIRDQLENVYDELVNKGLGDAGVKEFDKISTALSNVGLSGESLSSTLPNVFGILNDPNLNKSQVIDQITQAFIDAGDSVETARSRAQEFFEEMNLNRKYKAIRDFRKEFEKNVEDKLSRENANIVATEFARGVQDGLTGENILENISRAIYDATYTNGIESGLNPAVAGWMAQQASDSVKNTVTENMEGFFVDVEYRSRMNNDGLPAFMKDAVAEYDRTNGSMGTPTWGYVDHKFNVSGTLDLSIGSADNPMWVQIKGGGSTSSGSTSSPTTRTNPYTGKTEYWNGSKWVVLAASGGYIRRGTGGMVYGPGGPTEDLIPTMLSNGEYVIKAASVDKFGIPFLDAINSGMFPQLASGGYSRYPSMISGMYRGGYARAMKAMNNLDNSHGSQYNINVNVEGTNASADDIANKVMQSLQRRDKMNRAGIRI